MYVSDSGGELAHSHHYLFAEYVIYICTYMVYGWEEKAKGKGARAKESEVFLLSSLPRKFPYSSLLSAKCVSPSPKLRKGK
jgi:hypothetical protein